MSANQTHWKKLTDPNYLGSWDLPNGSITVTIKRVEQKQIFNQTKQKEEACVIAEFSDPGIKPMVLNKTNCKTVQKLTGSPFIEAWAGHRIEIKVEKVKAFGEVVDALRVSKIAPPAAKPQQQPQTQPEPQKCENCGEIVTEFGGYSAQQVAESTKAKYGRAMCAECAKKAKAELEEKA